MYKCKDCGTVFEEPTIWYDDPSPDGVGLPSGYYIYEKCPECGSDAIEEANECPRCETYYLGDTVLCEDCMKELGRHLNEIKGIFHLDDDSLEQAIAEYFGW